MELLLERYAKLSLDNKLVPGKKERGTAVAFASWFGISFWMIAAGIIEGLLSAVFGLVDRWTIPPEPKQKRLGFGKRGWRRRVTAMNERPRAKEPGLWGAGWHRSQLAMNSSTTIGTRHGMVGGDLVDQLGGGVDNGANLNAPSSLSGRPATEEIRNLKRDGLV